VTNFLTLLRSPLPKIHRLDQGLNTRAKGFKELQRRIFFYWFLSHQRGFRIPQQAAGSVAFRLGALPKNLEIQSDNELLSIR